jgi:S1-C subfamily serine protease
MQITRMHRSLAVLLLSIAMILAGCEFDEALLSEDQPAVGAQIAPTATPSPLLNNEQDEGGRVTQAQEPSPPPRISDEAALADYEEIVNSVYTRNRDAVVNITGATGAFGGGGTGSGFIYDRAGHIVTNYHVVENMREIGVTFADGSISPAEVVGAFPQGDIAVIRAEQVPSDVEPVELGDSSQIRVGEIAIAMGSPLGLEQTVTSGIVSALNRSVTDLGVTDDPDSSLHGLIQTDAAINPGNSGGPLFNSRGQVIGMNTLIASPTGGNIGLGFAIPVNRIKRVAGQIIETGRYQRPIMGVNIVRVLPSIARELNLPTTNGVMVAEVVPGGPADEAGLQGATDCVQVTSNFCYPTNGDIIVAIDGQEVRTIGDLRNILETEHEAGDTITVTYLRDGQEQQTQLTLAGE